MKTQRGNFYVVLALAIAAGLVLWGLVHAWTTYTEGLDKKAFDRGVQETTAKYQARDNRDLQAALLQVQLLEDQARQQEAEHVLALNAIDEQLQKEKAHAKDQAARVAADIAAGRLVRRDDAFQGGGCGAVDAAGTAGAPGAGTGGGDGPAPCELSGAAKERVLEIGTSADDVARQLAACQAVVIEDRRLCGAPNASPRSNTP